MDAVSTCQIAAVYWPGGLGSCSFRILSCPTPWIPSIHGAVTCSTCAINGLGTGWDAPVFGGVSAGMVFSLFNHTKCMELQYPSMRGSTCCYVVNEMRLNR